MDGDLMRWLEARRQREGLTARDFARRMAIPPSIYSRYLSGQLHISDGSFAKIVTFFDQDCRELISLWKQGRVA